MIAFTLVGGKGGVGKTTCAAAMAVARAEAGRRVIAISTDPAHSLGDAFGARLGPRPARVPTTRGALHALELDANAALDRWLRRHRALLVEIGERGTYLDRADVERFMDLSFPGVSELLALREVVRVASAARVDEAILDTAPTGHTLRLLATPEAMGRIATVLDDLQAKHRALVEAVNRRYVGDDAADRFIATLAGEAASLAAWLRDPARVRVVWVTLPEPLAIAETRDGLHALAASGIAVETLVINRVTPEDGSCPACRARRRTEAASVRAIGPALPRGAAIRRVPTFDREPVGLPALRRVGRALAGLPPRTAAPKPSRPGVSVKPRSPRARTRRGPPAPLAAILESPPRLLFTMGKGGVGKTTAAAALAIALARAHGRRVLLLSVDPAHSIGDVLASAIGNETVRVRSVPGVELHGDARQDQGRVHARQDQGRAHARQDQRRAHARQDQRRAHARQDQRRAHARQGVWNLDARALDAEVEFARSRDAYRAAVDEIFDRLRGDSRFDAAHDRRVAHDLIELAPPGLDELFALIAMIDLVADPRGSPSAAAPPAARYDHIVVDTAPTGHALRLFEMRAQAHEWVRALMTVLLKYGPVLHPGALAADLVALSKGLRQLDAVIADPRQCAIVAVTRAAALPRLETVRLVRALARLHVAPPAFALVNAVTEAGPCVRCRTAAEAERIEIARLHDALGGCAIILAPAVAPPPSGVAALARWIDRWQ